MLQHFSTQDIKIFPSPFGSPVVRYIPDIVAYIKNIEKICGSSLTALHIIFRLPASRRLCL